MNFVRLDLGSSSCLKRCAGMEIRWCTTLTLFEFGAELAYAFNALIAMLCVFSSEFVWHAHCDIDSG